ncbi:MAG: YDG domain-containing protein [Rhodoferax sp.]|uniref:YDG domain-containing protein n=1 Tax=Rhodoferax sp. TaxID=50421 RepID=UPI00262001EE|nr:YDG domain-containing protein [Rhodoferax sp.]MDD5332155.1 YDG domain-containing protein [Rhodoferax sp.]
MGASGTLNLGGSFVTASLGTIAHAIGGVVNITGTLDNTGKTLDIGSAGFGSGGLSSLSGSTAAIKGGTVISGDGTTLSMISNPDLYGVTLGNATSPNLTISGNFDVYNGLTLAGGANVNMGSGILWVNGAGAQAINVASGTATLTMVNGTLMQSTGGQTLTLGSGLTVSGYGSIYGNYSAETINNNGTLDANVSGKTLSLSGSTTTFNNIGTLLASAGTLDASASVFNNNGTIKLASGGTFSRSAGFTNPASGIIQGNGFINLGTATLVNQGIISPGATGSGSIGQLNITGNLTNAGDINIDIGGLVPSTQHDKLMVSGTATLGGKLNVSNLASYAPTTTDSFNVLGAGSITGTFATVSTPPASTYATQYSSALAWLSLSPSALPSNINAWLPDADGNWNVAGNWTNQALPTASNSVVIDRPSGVYTVTASYGTLLAGSLMSNENLLLSGGSLTVSGNSTLGANTTLGTGAVVNLNGGATNKGTLSGVGSLTVGTSAAALLNQGTISPAGMAVIGTLNIVGDLQLANSSNLKIEVAGTATGQFDKLAVSGNVVNGGTLTGSLLTGYAPASLDAIGFMTKGGTASGIFATTSLPTGFHAGYNLATGEAARLIYASGSGANIFTNGGGTLDWATPGNWSSGSLPGSTDTALISAGNLTVTHVTGADSIAALTINGNNTLSVAGGSLAVSGATTLAGALTVAGTGSVTLTGALNGATAGQVTLVGGSLNLGSTSDLKSLNLTAGTVTTVSGAALRAGAVSMAAGATLAGTANLVLKTDSLTLPASGASLTSVGSLSIQPLSNSQNMRIGGTNPGTGLYLSGLSQLAPGTALELGSNDTAYTGATTLAGAISVPSGKGLTLRGGATSSAGSLYINAPITWAGTETVKLSAGSYLAIGSPITNTSGTGVLALSGGGSIWNTGSYPNPNLIKVGSLEAVISGSSTGSISLSGMHEVGTVAMSVANSGGSISFENNKAGGLTIGTVGATNGINVTGGGSIHVIDYNGGIRMTQNVTAGSGSMGTVTISSDVGSPTGGAPGSIVLDAGKAISGTSVDLKTSGLANDLSLNGDISASSGSVTLNSGRDVVQNGNISATGGSVTVTGRAIAMGTLGSGNLVKTQTTGGSINYTSTSGAIAAGLLDAAAGQVFITAASSVLDNNGSALNVKGNSLSITSQNGAASGLAISLDTKVASLSAWAPTTLATGVNGDITLRNQIPVTLGTIHTGGAVTVANAGAVATAVDSGGISGNGVSVAATGGGIAVAALSSINGGTGDVLLKADGTVSVETPISTTSGSIKVVSGTGFSNLHGAGEFVTGTGGRWLVYAPAPSIVPNGLVPTLYQYNTAYGGSVAASGSGFIYASPLYVDANFGGTLSSTYGSPATATAGYTLRGLDARDTLTAALIVGSGVSYSNWPISASTPAGSYALQYSGLSPALPYALSTGTAQSYTVNPAQLTGVNLTASLTGVANKTYDGTLNASLAPGNFLLSGFVNADSAYVTKTTGTYASQNVGSGILVSTTLAATDFSPLGSTNLSNYILPNSVSGNIGSITPASLTVSANNASKTYDRLAYTGGNGVNYSGFVNGETTSVLAGAPSYGGSAQGASRAGSYAIAPAGLTAANYTLGYVNGTLTIDKATITAVSGIAANNKVYDGNTSATLNTASAILSGALSGDNVAVAAASGSFADKNAGTGKTVNITGLSLGGADAGNYTLSATPASTTADITRAAITGVSGIVINDKVYDGNTTATAVASNASLTGLIGGDKVSVGSVSAAFGDRNVGVGKTVNLSNLALSGPDAANYTWAGSAASAKGTITVRPLSTWTAAGSGQWSDAGNWDALPDASNVLAVAIPAGVLVTYDAGAGSTSLQALGGAGGFSLSGGSLSIGSGLSTPQYNQSGGSLNLAGSLSVNGSFSQSAGSIAASGPVEITQNSSNLTVGAITAPAISLTAPSGNIGQGGALIASGLLSTQSSGSTTLNDAGNRIGSFKAASTGSGNIELTNVGVIDVQGIHTAAGNITLYNTGGISTSGPVVANGGKVSMTANSPLTIGSAGVSASGDIDLVATDLTSAGNLTLNGDLVSSAGAIGLRAANNFVQNSKVSAALGLVVSAGGSVTLGPSATSFGNPVSYPAQGTSVVAPPGSLSTASGSAPTDYVVAFVTQFEKAVVAPLLVSLDPLGSTDKDKKSTMLEGDICLR